jgi:hypothetical protein
MPELAKVAGGLFVPKPPLARDLAGDAVRGLRNVVLCDARGSVWAGERDAGEH